jgi:hypothetical protein
LPGRLARRVSLGLLSVLLSLSLMEGVLQIVQPIPSEQLLPLPFHERRLRRLVKGEAYVTYDQELVGVTTPGIRQRVGGDLYRHNEAGMRAEREYDPTPPPDVLRIAAFGDSFTYCHEADFNDCWTEQLEESWSGSETLNFGVPGYGPDQAWLRYQREGRAYAPSVVLIGYMTENINRVVNRYRPSLAPITNLLATNPRFLLEGDGLRLLENPATSPELLSEPRWAESVASGYDPGASQGRPLTATIAETRMSKGCGRRTAPVMEGSRSSGGCSSSMRARFSAMVHSPSS